jgi:hypothetical protein
MEGSHTEIVKEIVILLYHLKPFVMNTRLFLPMRPFFYQINKLAILSFLILFYSSCNQAPKDSVSSLTDTSKITTATWNVNFKTDTTDLIKELYLYSVEKALMDSVYLVKKNMNKDFHVTLSRVQNPFGNKKNYQVRLEFSGNDAGYFNDHPIILPQDSIILKIPAHGPPPHQPQSNGSLAIASLAKPIQDTIIINVFMFKGASTIPCPTMPCPVE